MGLSYSANAAVVVVNTLIPNTHWRLRSWIRLLIRVLSSASSIDASIVVVDTLGFLLTHTGDSAVGDVQ